MSYPHQNDDQSFNYDMYNNTLGVHQVVHNHQLRGHPSFGVNNIASASSSGTSHSVEMFVPMNIPRHNRDGSLTVLFQLNNERNSLSVPLDECLKPDGGLRLKNPQEIMFLTLDRIQSPFLNLVIAWPGYDTVVYPIEIGTIEAPITRIQLARQIAYAFFLFSNSCDDNNFTQTQRSHSWKVGGQDGYSFLQMHLSAFWNIEGNAWGASIRVLRNI
ncbi:hypothetical protein DFH29DRAFT_1067977 [Suillus ampliporus]|nr:hypothetical protein DFH29DRAFT_1067977 [Suillus ampliporus]